MSSNAAPWDTFDPLVDGLYCQVPYSNEDVLSESTFAAHKPEKATIHRYEEVARRYLSGRAPLLITSSLRGPFDRASGFVNPWSSAIQACQPTSEPSASPHLLNKQSQALCEPAASPRLGETQTTESSYLPSPESLNLCNHPFLEHDEVARVEKWRDLVESNIPSREEFWVSKSRSSTKRPREDSSWLKRLADKRPRKLEPEPRLSSPVSIPDKNLRQREASSPLSSLSSLSGQPPPWQVSSQVKIEAKAHSGESAVAYASQKALASSSLRQSQRANQSTRLVPGSETLRRERRRTQYPSAGVSKASSRHTAPSRRSSPVAELQRGSVSPNGLTTESEASQFSDEVSETRRRVVGPAEEPTVFAEFDEVMEERDITQSSQPGKERILQEIDANAAPSKGGVGGEDAMPPATRIAFSSPSRKSADPDPKIHGPSVVEEGSKHSVTDSSVSTSLNPDPRDDKDNLDGCSRDRAASEHPQEEVGPLPTSALVENDRSTSTSVTSASSVADLISATLVEDDDHLSTDDAPLSHEQLLLEPAAFGIMSNSESMSTGSAALQNEGQPQQTEAPSTPQANPHTKEVSSDCMPQEPSTPDKPIAAQEQSYWVNDSSRDLGNGASEGGYQPSNTTREDEQTQSFVIPPEAQSPWIKRPVSQPQVANDAFSTSSSSPQLPPPSQETREEAQPQAGVRSNLLPDVSNTDFSIKSFSSFMSPVSKPQLRASDAHLPHTSILLAAATENPWQSSKPKKRVSWAPLPHEVDGDLNSPAPTSSFSRASPPPTAPIPDHVEEGADVFKNHFATVKRRTDPVRQRLLPSVSQQIQRSPETEAMARAFVAAEMSPGSSPTKVEEKREVENQTVGFTEGSGSEEVKEAPVDEVDDVLANLGDFLTTWDVETDLQRARAEDHTGPTATKGILNVEIGGW